MGHHSEGHDRHRLSWRCTMLTQAGICMAMYLAFHVGTPTKSSFGELRKDGRALDVYFLSVCGGYRPPKQQTHLLKQMEKVAKAYKVGFVVNISELGEDDPLLQNGTLRFPCLKVPWYTTSTYASQGREMRHFKKQVALPHHETMDIIGVDTGSLHDLLHNGQPSNVGNDQLNWLMKTLASCNSKWRIVLGFHPLRVCNEQKHVAETIELYKPLHQIFLNYLVNAYLSKKGCSDHFIHDGGIAYIGNPSYSDESHRDPSVNGTSVFLKETDNGFLLHRVSPLEIVSYYINHAGIVMYKSTLHQRGREVI